MTQPAPAAQVTFPVTTALELEGRAVDQDLGIVYGVVVRSMGAVKSIGAGFKALRWVDHADLSRHYVPDP